MSDKHLSSQFDADLNAVSSRMLAMGGLVEQQIIDAMRGLNDFDRGIIDHVIATEEQVNQSEVDIDQECVNLIALRQPAARDLRLVISIFKSITGLERAGDEVAKIAKSLRRLVDEPGARTINVAEIKISGEMVVSMLRGVLDAFARLDAVAAAQIVKSDKDVDNEFRGFARKVVTYMQEDPRTISVCLEYLSIAKAIERIGDHAKNIAEFIIYVTKGSDVRHQPRDVLDNEVNS
jgi:phosphate transport system protein